MTEWHLATQVKSCSGKVGGGVLTLGRITFERVESFTSADGWKGLLVVKLVIEIRGQHLHPTLLTLLLRVTAIGAAQERQTQGHYSARNARPGPAL